VAICQDPVPRWVVIGLGIAPQVKADELVKANELVILCDGKVKDIYKSKELWRGPESIYRKEVVLALSGDILTGER
jgi:hypothetical protein